MSGDGRCGSHALSANNGLYTVKEEKSRVVITFNMSNALKLQVHMQRGLQK